MILPEGWVYRRVMSSRYSMNRSLLANFQSNLCYYPSRTMILLTGPQRVVLMSRALWYRVLWFQTLLRGMYWYTIELAPPDWIWLGWQISRNKSTKHSNHLHLLPSDYSSKQYDNETSQLCQKSTSFILHISQHELLYPIIIHHNNTERWMGMWCSRWFWVRPRRYRFEWFTDKSTIEWVSQPFANLIPFAFEDTNVL